MMQPVMKQVETTYPGQVKIVFHDVWTTEGRTEGAKYKISRNTNPGVPGQQGQRILQARGLLSLTDIEKILQMKGVK
jgi:thioredoxin 1